MKILGIEFSAEARSVALWVDGAVAGSASEVATRTTHAFALIEKVLAAARVGREEVGCLAIGLGPGSYTGIRSALALAQGWQLATGIKLLGIASTECLAETARREGIFGTVNVVIDAQRNEFYLARYEIEASGYREIGALKLASLEEVGRYAAAGEVMVGPEVTRWFAGGRTLAPSAAVLAGLASGRTDFTAGEALEPIYLRETNFVKAPTLRVLPE